jgi:hypothetical protein
LDEVVSFSTPVLSSGKDVQLLLQRLPAVRKLSCLIEKSPGNDEESIEKLDFRRKLESLKLYRVYGNERKYLINFPPTLKKLTLNRFVLLWTDISAIAELHCLQVLKLRDVSIQEKRLEMEDLVFQNLKFFELFDLDLVEWNASIESLPCLEQLVIDCDELEELPSCFGEISTLKRIVVKRTNVESSAFRIREEQMELGNEVEVSM